VSADRSLAIFMREPWKPVDGDSKCQQCYGPNPIWFCESRIWNQVVGGDPDQEAGGILCPSCFMVKAEAANLRPAPLAPLWEVVQRWPQELAPPEFEALQELRADREAG
jgi:hypothetical protein